MDDWKYVQHQVITDPKGRSWSVALMDVLGQEGDPDLPNEWLQLQFAAGRYFTLIYSAGGTLQWEQAYPSLPAALRAYERLVAAIVAGHIDPMQPAFREDLED